LQKQAAGLGLTDQVEFPGWVEFEKLPALLNSVTMVLMPSRWLEGFGLVALDAALMARPIVATRSGGVPEVVVHGHTGLLVEREDRAAFADAITYLLDHPDLATRMGQAARSRAQAVFAWDRHVDAFDRLYQQLLEQAPRAESPSRSWTTTGFAR
jgi:glycogen(starch) synthase